jgi:hypothetical protein
MSFDLALVLQGAALAGQAVRFVVDAIWRYRDRGCWHPAANREGVPRWPGARARYCGRACGGAYPDQCRAHHVAAQRCGWALASRGDRSDRGDRQARWECRGRHRRG